MRSSNKAYPREIRIGPDKRRYRPETPSPSNKSPHRPRPMPNPAHPIAPHVDIQQVDIQQRNRPIPPRKPLPKTCQKHAKTHQKQPKITCFLHFSSNYKYTFPPQTYACTWTYPPHRPPSPISSTYRQPKPSFSSIYRNSRKHLRCKFNPLPRPAQALLPVQCSPSRRRPC